MLRSPTIALVLSKPPYNYNTRACGIVSSYALIKLDEVLLRWADEIVCADNEHVREVKRRLTEFDLDTPVVDLNLPDIYEYRDPKLIKFIEVRYKKYLEETIAEE